MATQVKYIKLGEKGQWEDICLQEGTLRLGYYEVPHELALAGDKKAICEIYLAQGKKQQAASNHARQALDFYQADSETIWITFSKGMMWWCRTHSDVEFMGQDKTLNPYGSRLRRTIGKWNNTSITGQALRMNELSGRLTSVAGFQGTICNVNDEAMEYALRKIKGEELPLVTEALTARQELKKKLELLISYLTWADFELFADILFTRSGWVRISPAGETMKDIDMELIQPVTGERAVVQVKSKTTQTELDEYAHRLQNYGAKVFYVYHTPAALLTNRHQHINFMNVEQLADAALRSGMVDWLINKM